jgi:hypothetical protein
VREAYRLLQKSIILVENEDIELEDIEEVRRSSDVVMIIGAVVVVGAVALLVGACIWEYNDLWSCGSGVFSSTAL